MDLNFFGIIIAQAHLMIWLDLLAEQASAHEGCKAYSFLWQTQKWPLFRYFQLARFRAVDG